MVHKGSCETLLAVGTLIGYSIQLRRVVIAFASVRCCTVEP